MTKEKETASVEQQRASSRRDFMKVGAIGAAAIAAPAVAVGAQKDKGAAAPQKELSGKTSFITGGARGIGLATAQELARAGSDIVLFDIASKAVSNVQYALADDADLQSAKASIEALGVKCLAIKGDVRDRKALNHAMARTVSELGSLDIVVANAGVSQAGSIEEFSDADIKAVYDINVTGVILTTQAAAPHMKKQKSGRIIYISSGLGRVGNELFPIYTSTKWAVIGFAKSAAVTYGRDNILCNVVAPGLARTKLADNPYILKKMMPDDPNPTFDKLSAMLMPGNPLAFGHVEPVDVAKAILFFAGSATTKVTGEVFDVSYGSNARNVA
ncbi:MAG: SDR family NAD(P)-dependent oxidoreductase [Sphingorhabdus sp.]